MLASAERESWFPLIFDRSVPAEAEAMDELMNDGEVVYIHDMLEAQLKDLVRSRTPSKNYTDDEVAQEIVRLLADQTPQNYGRWAFYPWSRRMVHLLPPDSFIELRSDRNRNKITSEEQARLRKIKIALAGLSVGNAVAVTLALEGVFGELRLADFDTLDLSNMNRIRCAVHHLGLNKAIIAARQIYEQNPYANLVLFTDGVTTDNIGEFIDGTGPGDRADIVIDECDSVQIKLKLREEARARRLPVLMETSDRGMLDIERFDLEPDRPILHGLVGNVTSDQVNTLSPPARLGLVLQIAGLHTISPRLAASLLELNLTLKGFSQLGSDVTLGGATTTTAVRRLALGMPLASGRVYIDVSGQLAEVTSPPLPDLSHPRRLRETAEVRELVQYAIMAPSHGNDQPWRFEYGDGVLRVLHDTERGGGRDEIGRHWALVAIGGALANLQIAAGVKGREANIQLFPPKQDPSLVAEVRFGLRAGGPADDPLFEEIPRRNTNRGLGTRAHLSPVHVQALSAAARDSGAKLQLCTDRALLGELGQLIGEAERLRLLTPTLHGPTMRQIRWSEAEAHDTQDGIRVEALAVTPMDFAAFQLLRSTDVAKVLRDTNGGRLLMMSSVQALASSAAVGLLTIPGQSPTALVRGGQAMQQLWLTASALGVAVHPMNTLIDMFARVERFHGAGFDKREIQRFLEMRERFTRAFTVALADVEILLFRLSYADPAPLRTLRRPVDAVFSVPQPEKKSP
ncbi:Rv1355c family protein [Nannocystis pusilla]|uniref:Rv1355c family protein n=1 Tax=Nannocystis pusilla TaxID=889268 RepID=A0A9X3EXE2_9BACT|nr:Rv1355c family protein [Nannocystis pusilla]